MEVKQYADFRGELVELPDSLYQYLKFDDEMSRKTELLYIYARIHSDQDTTQQGYQDISARAQSLFYKASEYSPSIAPEISSIPEETLDGFMKVDNGISHFGRTLEVILDKCRHTLSGEMEGLLAQSYDATQGASQISTMFNSADVKFPVIIGENGRGIQTTHDNCISLMENKDRRVRKDALEGLYGVCARYSNTLAAASFSNVKRAISYAKAKKYGSSRQYYLVGNGVPELIYDNLVQAARKNLPRSHYYMTLRETRLGVGELHMYDPYVSMVLEVDHHCTYEETKAIVEEGLVPLGEKYLSVLQEDFNNRWVDVYEDEGERGGAYSWGAYGSHPCMLLNLRGTLNDVSTLAHEMGRSIHSWYSDKNQPFAYAGYKISMAEVAFTCNGALLIRHLLGKAEDKKEKVYLLNHSLESSRGTLFRQTMFAEFESMAHKEGAVGESLTAQSLCREYHQLNAGYFGGGMTVDPQIDYEWERVPYFYTPSHVYQCAAGFSAAMAISSRIMRGESGALEGYRKPLSGGCSMTPIGLLKLYDADMPTTKPVDEASSFFEELLGELEKIDHN